MTAHQGFEAAREIADAVLYEGYLLYPYRATAHKNQLRWQFGVLVPPAFHDLGERSTLTAEVLAQADTDEVEVLVRFLHLQRRQLQRRLCSGDGGDEDFIDVDELVVDGTTLRSFEEAVPRERRLRLGLGGDDLPAAIVIPAEAALESLADAAGEVVGRVMRRHAEIRLDLRASRARVEVGSASAVWRVRVELRNTSALAPSQPGDTPEVATGGEPRRWAIRGAALAASPLSTHVLIGLRKGRWLSATAPPAWAAAASQDCTRDGAWPVLVGRPRTGDPDSSDPDSSDPDSSDTVMLSPIILSDHPVVAAQSPINLFDGTEIDELLTLRTMALTPEEKAEARATDPRAAAIIDHADHLPPAMLERLHGAIRRVEQPPGPPDVKIDGKPIEAGMVVRLNPGKRRADAQDMFLADQLATVEAVIHDLDGRPHVAVTLLEDPGADLQRATGRFRYFAPDEVVPQ